MAVAAALPLPLVSGHGELSALAGLGEAVAVAALLGQVRHLRHEEGLGSDAGRGDRVERVQNSNTAVPVHSCRFDVDGVGGQKRPDLRVGQGRAGRLDERGDRAGVRRSRRGSEEGIEAGSGAGHAIGSREVGLLEQLPAGRREVSRGDGGSVGVEKEAARSVGAESVDDARRRERRREDRSDGGSSDAEGVGRRRCAVAVDLARGGDRQFCAIGRQVQEARGGSRAAHDDQAVARGRSGDLLVGILRPILDVVRGRDDGGAGGIEHVEVVVVGGRAERIGPEQGGRKAAPRSLRHRVGGRPAAEVVELARLEGGGAPAIVEVPFPGSGSPVVEIAGVAGRGEVERARARDGVDRFLDEARAGGRHDAAALTLLKRRFDDVEDVVDDDVATRRAQVADVLCHGGRAAPAGRVEELGVGSEVVNDLEHCRAFVAVSRSVRQHRHRRQVSGGLKHREGIDAVGEDADLDPGSRNAVRGSGEGGAVGHISLGGVQRQGLRDPPGRRAARGLAPGLRVAPGSDEDDRRVLRQRFDGLGGNARPHAAKLAVRGHDLCAEGPQPCEERVIHRSGDVHFRCVRIVDDHVRPQARHSGRRGFVPVLPQGVQEPRVELLLGRRRACFSRISALI